MVLLRTQGCSIVKAPQRHFLEHSVDETRLLVPFEEAMGYAYGCVVGFRVSLPGCVAKLRVAALTNSTCVSSWSRVNNKLFA